MSSQPEVWLRGTLPGLHPVLQPVAHALLQSQEEIHRYTRDFPDNLLWVTPAGAASAGFHLQHLRGVLDRLFTYARGSSLSPDQLEYLQSEGKPFPGLTVQGLVASVDSQIEESLGYLKTIDPADLTVFRPVGRKALPSTVLGLLFHAAEHSQRHVGQLYVTLRVAREQAGEPLP